MVFLSICIPTYQRIEITRNTIASIYADMKDVDISEFEVIVSDNDISESSRCFVDEFPFENFHYYQTRCEGFLNSFHVLGYGKGLFLKLHNNYTMLKAGTLKYMIEEIKRYYESKAPLFFTNGLRQFYEKREYTTFNDYMSDLSYFSSWSSGFGIWKEDYDHIKSGIVINKWFPQTSLFLPFNKKNIYVLNDIELFNDQKVPKKGGYNPYYVFGVEFLTLIKVSYNKEQISFRCFERIKRDLLKDYLASRYFKTVIAKMDNFEHNNIREYLLSYYGKFAYYKLFFYSLLTPFKYYIRKSRSFFIEHYYKKKQS